MRSNHTRSRNTVKSEPRKSWNGLRGGHLSRLRREAMKMMWLSEPWLYVVLSGRPTIGFPHREEGRERNISYFTP